MADSSSQPPLEPARAEAPASQLVPEVAAQTQATAPAPAAETSTTNGAVHQEAYAQSAAGQGMSANEIALYDRQIRLWGKQAQEKIRTASVLLVGIKGLGNEIAKNLVLSGIGSLTVVDDGIVTEEDLGCQFLLRQENIGQNRAQATQKELQALNPRVKLFADTSSVLELAIKPTFFQAFNIVIATDLTIDQLQPLNAACRLGPRPFYAAGTYGLYGYVFADLGAHTFVIEREKSNIDTVIGPETMTRSVIGSTTKHSDTGKTIELVTKIEQYSPLSQAFNAPLPADRTSNRRRKLQVSPALACIRALWRFQMETARPAPSGTHNDLARYTQLATHEHKNLLGLPHETMKSETLRAFLQGVTAEINPTCAFLGGQVAQDVIHVIGQNEQPVQNFLIFDGDEFTGEVYAMHAPPAPPEMIPVAIPIQSVPLPAQAQAQAHAPAPAPVQAQAPVQAPAPVQAQASAPVQAQVPAQAPAQPTSNGNNNAVVNGGPPSVADAANQ